MRIKQSLCYPIYDLNGLSLDELFKIGAEIGYVAVEMWQRGDDLEEVVGLARKHNLAVASMCGHQSLADGLNKRSNHARIEDELKTSIDIAARHGIPGVICFSGNRQPYQAEVEAIEAVADGLRRVAPYAERKKVNLNLELLNSKVDHPGYQCDHTAWGVAVCERVNSPRAKLLYDIYHMQIMEGDLIRTITANLEAIAHVHIAGVPGRNDPDATQEIFYPAVMRALAASTYYGWIGQEFIPRADPIAALEEAFRACNVG